MTEQTPEGYDYRDEPGLDGRDPGGIATDDGGRPLVDNGGRPIPLERPSADAIEAAEVAP